MSTSFNIMETFQDAEGTIPAVAAPVLTTDEKVVAYLQSIGFVKELQNIDDLIRSHRSMRERLHRETEEIARAFNMARTNGYKWGVSQAEENTIQIESLRGMTLEELTRMLID